MKGKILFPFWRLIFLLEFWSNARRDYYIGLKSAKSLQDIKTWALSNTLIGFNRDVIRTAIIGALAEISGATVFVETGTYHGVTSLCAKNYLHLPVYSCEISLKNFIISRIMTIGVRNIKMFKGSSPKVLYHLVSSGLLLNESPLFYLDAHWGKYLPLMEEIKLITQLERFAVIVDDFQVPGKSFGYDIYNGLPLGLELVRDTLLSKGIAKCYLPNYAPEIETGFRRGYCIFWKSFELDKAYQEGIFPLNLLTLYELKVR